MEEKEFTDKVGEIMTQISIRIANKAKQALGTGALDLERYDNNYQLPKIFIYAILRDLADQYKPFNKSDVRESNNLRHFL